jgi:ABC-2 type transport system permease protein
VTRPGLVLHQIRHQNRVFWRVPLAAFFTVAFPLMLLVLFNLLNRGVTLPSMGGLPYAQFFTPAIAVFAMVSATYTSVAIQTGIDRDDGILKRVRGTPLPPGTYLAGRIGSALWIGVLSVAATMATGVLAFDVVVLWDRVPMALLVLTVGAACFCALGLALAAAASNAQSAQALANATILPLAFISGIFFPLDTAPAWMGAIAGIFPLQAFVEAFGAQWNPLAEPGIPWADLGIMVAWFAAAVVVARRTFTWEPRPGGSRRRRR